MVLTILLWIVLGIIALVLAVSIAPIAIQFKGSIGPTQKQAQLIASYISPIILRVDVDTQSIESSRIVLLSRFVFPLSKEEPVEPPPQTQHPPVESPIVNQLATDHQHQRYEKNQSTTNKSETVIHHPVPVPPKVKQSAPEERNSAPPNPSSQKKASLFAWLKSKQDAWRMFKQGKIYFLLKQHTLQKKLFHWVLGIFKTFFRIMHIDLFKVHVTGGFEDPALTGKVYGYFLGGSSALNLHNSRRIDLKYAPQFVKSDFKADAAVVLTTSVARLVFPVVWGLITFPYVTTFLVYWKMRKIGKNDTLPTAGNSAFK